jgi:hypothetical protein
VLVLRLVLDPRAGLHHGELLDAEGRGQGRFRGPVGLLRALVGWLDRQQADPDHRHTRKRSTIVSPTVTSRRPSQLAEPADSLPPEMQDFLRSTAEPVRETMVASVTLKDFLATAGELTLDERRLLVDQALILLNENYVHLPFKVAMHGINPLRRLRLLRTRLDRQTAETMDPEREFHAELSAIFHSMRDLHTNYLLPQPYKSRIAYLPFLIEEYRDGTGSHYIVGHLVEGYSAPGFVPGAEITHWNGIPIDRAVDINAARFAGSNLAARHLRGVESLTLRALKIHLPPDEEWVTVNYIDADGVEREISEQWLVVENLPAMVDEAGGVTAAMAAVGLDIGADELNRAKRMLFKPQSVAQERIAEATGAPARVTDDASEVPSTMPGVFRASSVVTPSGTFGHIRIFTFSVNDPDAFVAEFVRLIEQLPQNGLIVDVRGNGGGHIYASEFTLQTLSPRQIAPEPVQFVNSPLNLRICRKFAGHPDIDLAPWVRSMDQALETGEVFSGAFPLTPVDGANAIGQKYSGPVVLVTDAGCYSATDIFAAGFQDHGIGPVLGVDDNTGAGGANVWTHELLKLLLDLDPADPGTPYKPLPREAGMRVSIRRTLRVGEITGTPLEDLGVTPDLRHELTRNDVLQGNVDLLNRAGEILATMPVRRLAATAVVEPPGELKVTLEVDNLDRADIFVDGRPRETIDLAGPTATVQVQGVPGASSVHIKGFQSGALAAARTLTV